MTNRRNKLLKKLIGTAIGEDEKIWEEREQLLFKSTDFGDDKDRALQKHDGSWTYFASDVAYHKNKLLKKLVGTAIGEDEKKLYQLTIERICADMCDYYFKFYHNEGPGAMVYVPEHEDEKKSMFYLTVDNLITAVDDLNKRDMEGAADVMKQAITRSEKLDPDKEALFIIQDSKQMSLVHYKIDSEGASFKMM